MRDLTDNQIRSKLHSLEVMCEELAKGLDKHIQENEETAHKI